MSAGMQRSSWPLGIALGIILVLAIIGAFLVGLHENGLVQILGAVFMAVALLVALALVATAMRANC